MKWVWGVAGARPSVATRALYQKALVCRTFPAYRLEDLGRDKPVAEILQAMALLDLAAKAEARE